LYPPPAQTEKSSPDFASENINIGEERKKNKLQTLLKQRAKKGERRKKKKRMVQIPGPKNSIGKRERFQ
jgi:hypothetical protein